MSTPIPRLRKHIHTSLLLEYKLHELKKKLISKFLLIPMIYLIVMQEKYSLHELELVPTINRTVPRNEMK